jgi:intracellular sulfur oxidation DsrE/DsrF family protein
VRGSSFVGRRAGAGRPGGGNLGRPRSRPSPPTRLPVSHLATGRRGFLARLGAAAAAFAAGTPAHAAAPLAAPGDELEPWLRALRGKHKQLFHSHDKMDGTVLWQARAFLDYYKEPYGLAPDQINVVVAAHGQTGGMLLNDLLWRKYEMGKLYKVNMPDPSPASNAPAPDSATGAEAKPARVPATRNVYYTPKAGDPVNDQTSVDALMRLGVTFLICDNALKQFANYTARKSGVTHDVALKELHDNLVPGAIAVPTMLIAINRAQERGCSYLYSG